MSRPARTADLDHVVRVVTLAFADDPIWGPALRGLDGPPDDHAAYWRLFVEGAHRYGTVFVSDGSEAVSIWIPPDGSELTAEKTLEFEWLVAAAMTPTDLAALHDLYGRFEASRAGRPAHYYLSLLATDPAHRGLGHGQRLLAEDLGRWDEAGVPSYLESTNPGNDHRYRRAGFETDGGFRAVRDDAWVSAMWRPVGGVHRVD